MTISAPVAPPPPPPSGPQTFGFHMPTITHALLVLWGVFSAPLVTVDERQVTVRFGFFRSSFLLSDVDRFEIDGPYVWWRAVAVRNTFGKSDMSYCTDGRGAVRVYFTSQRRMHWVRHVDQVYLGVEDLDGLAADLRARGIPGEDKRRIKGA